MSALVRLRAAVRAAALWASARPRVLMLANWLVQFSLFLAIIFFTGLNSAHGLITLQLSPERMVEIYGFSDSGSYLQAALSLIEHGQNTPEWQWVFNLWPPGMVWLDAAIIRVSPLDFGVTLGLVSAAVWAMAFSVLTWPLLRSIRAAALVLLAELAIVASSPFQSWMLDEGLLYADGIASAAFLLGLAIVVNRAVVSGSTPVWVRDGIYAGIAFALAVYFRASYNLIPWVMVSLAVFIGVIALVRRNRGREARHLVPQLAFLVASALTIAALMLPYTAHLIRDRDRVQFVQTENLVYEHVWQNARTDEVPNWMLFGGSTVACDIDPDECARLEDERKSGIVHPPDELRDTMIVAIVTHPGQFVANRVAAVASQWFGDEISSYSRVPQDHTSGAVTMSGSPNYNPAQGFLYLALLLGACVLSVRLAAQGRWTLLIVPIAALAILAPFSIVHVEVRYLIPLKLIGLLVPLLLMGRAAARGSRAASVESVDATLDRSGPNV